MDSNEFREFGKAAVDFIADYLENIRDRDVLPSVQPGYLHNMLPDEMPEGGENYKSVLADINKCILPGVTHWQSPNFHAYYPTATSYPSIVGEMISAGLGVIGFSWICSPACTELEVIVMDWVGKFLNLPEEFLNCHDGPGGGVIQGSASEAVLVAVLAAREQTVERVTKANPSMTESEVRGKLVAYSSIQSNSCIEKAGLLAAVPIRLLPSDDAGSLRGPSLRSAIEEDMAKGLIPICCIATYGTTGTCSYDNVDELGAVCKEYNVWLHIDAAYAGAALCCPEYRHLMPSIHWAESINFNLHKWMMVNFDCCAMWFKDANLVVNSFNVDRIYLKHSFQGQSKAPDYRHWQIPLGRRFRALKVWITLRTIGAENIRKNIRKQIALADRFKNYVLSDNRFEIVAKPSMGLVCFRLKNGCEANRTLLAKVSERKLIYIIPAEMKGKVFLRFVICGMAPEEHDVDFAWKEITDRADEMELNTQNAISEKAMSGIDSKDANVETLAERLAQTVVVGGDEKQK